MDPSVLRDGNPSSFTGLSFGATKSSTKSFSRMIRTSVAAPLTDLEVDDKRLMTGNINKSSSCRTYSLPPTTYSENQITQVKYRIPQKVK